MKRRAELGAVEREHPIHRRIELNRRRFARLEAEVDVIIGNSESVRRVLGCVDIGDVPDHVVACLDGDLCQAV